MQRNVAVFHADVTNVLFTPPQVQHWPATFVVLTLVQAAVQLPELVLAPSFKP